MREMAMYQHWLQKTGTEKLYENPQIVNRLHQNKMLSLIDLKSIFILWFLLTTFATFMFFIEQSKFFVFKFFCKKIKK